MNETANTLINKVIDNTTSRLKIPIVSTYLFVLIFKSWDILFYLFFEKKSALEKINYIKIKYPNYWSNIFESVGIAILIIISISLLDMTLTYCLKEISIIKKKSTDEINNYKIVESLKKINSQLTKDFNELNDQKTQLDKDKAQQTILIDSLNSRLNSTSQDATIGRLILISIIDSDDRVKSFDLLQKVFQYIIRNTKNNQIDFQEFFNIHHKETKKIDIIILGFESCNIIHKTAINGLFQVNSSNLSSIHSYFYHME